MNHYKCPVTQVLKSYGKLCKQCYMTKSKSHRNYIQNTDMEYRSTHGARFKTSSKKKTFVYEIELNLLDQSRLKFSGI
jgi:hypothetical protein